MMRFYQKAIFVNIVVSNLSLDKVRGPYLRKKRYISEKKQYISENFILSPKKPSISSKRSRSKSNKLLEKSLSKKQLNRGEQNEKGFIGLFAILILSMILLACALNNSSDKESSTTLNQNETTKNAQTIGFEVKEYKSMNMSALLRTNKGHAIIYDDRLILPNQLQYKLFLLQTDFRRLYYSLIIL